MTPRRRIRGLVLVDLTTVQPAILNRYLSKDGAAAFLDQHGAGESFSPGGRTMVASDFSHWQTGPLLFSPARRADEV